jgi:hypothetical protein
VYEGQNSRGKTVYVWEKIAGGQTDYVRAEDFDESENIPLDGVRIRSAYRDDPDTIQGLIDRYDLTQIYP